MLTIKKIFAIDYKKKKIFVINCYKKLMTYEHIFDCEYYEKRHITSKHSQAILKKLNLSFLFAIFYTS